MKLRYIRLIEICTWLLIIFCGVSAFIYKTAIKDNYQNTYYMFFNDAGGLVKGSPVKLMGIRIGYVKDIKIFDNKVFISILVSKSGVKIPGRAKADITFFGLGGSASLDLTPEPVSETARLEEIIPSKTYRVKDFWDNNKFTAETMIDTYNSVRISIDSSGILNNKHILFQSGYLKQLVNQTKEINDAQTVIINKLLDSRSIRDKAEHQD